MQDLADTEYYTLTKTPDKPGFFDILDKRSDDKKTMTFNMVWRPGSIGNPYVFYQFEDNQYKWIGSITGLPDEVESKSLASYLTQCNMHFMSKVEFKRAQQQRQSLQPMCLRCLVQSNNVMESSGIFSLFSGNTNNGDTKKVENNLMEMDAYVFANVYNDFSRKAGSNKIKYWPSQALRQEAIKEIGINKSDDVILEQVKQQMKKKVFETFENERRFTSKKMYLPKSSTDEIFSTFNPTQSLQENVNRAKEKFDRENPVDADDMASDIKQKFGNIFYNNFHSNGRSQLKPDEKCYWPSLKDRDKQILEYCQQIYNESLSKSYDTFSEKVQEFIKEKMKTKVLEELIKYYKNNTTHYTLAKSLKLNDEIFDEFEFDNNVEFNLNRVRQAFERKYVNKK